MQLNVLRFACFLSAICGVVGFLAGVLYSVGGLIVDIFTIGLNAGTALAFLALIGMPVIFAVCGTVAGIVVAVIYNVLPLWMRDGIRPFRIGEGEPDG